MKLVTSETSLVIAGAWNPAILTPPWIMSHGLQREGDVQVQVFLPVSGAAAIEVPKYVFKEFSYLVRPAAFILAPSEDESDLTIIENIASRSLQVLQHTPITGVGHNFEFRQTQLDGAPLGVFTSSRQDLVGACPPEWRASDQTIISTFSRNNEASFVNINRRFNNDFISVKFNFHYPTETVENAIAVLRGDDGQQRMSENLAVATCLLSDLYGETE